MFDWLRKLFPSLRKTFTGVIDDPRPDSETMRDYKHEERLLSTASADGVFDNPKITHSNYFPENQWGTGSCVPHGVGLALGIEREQDIGSFVRLAYLFVYRLRKYYPQAGSWLQEMFDLYKRVGAPLFTKLPTTRMMTEAQANAVVLTQQMYTEAQIYRGDEYYTIENYKDINELAKVAQKGHGVPLIIFARYDEWPFVYPKVIAKNLTPIEADVRHCVCILQKSGFIENGIRYVAIQDSALFGGFSIRYLSEEFIAKRTNGAGYWDTVALIGSGPKPQYTFTKVLKYGAVGPEVVMLQKLLISEGLLPIDCATGRFLGRTLAGVQGFQNKYAEEILKPLGLDAPTETWGSMCIAKANTLTGITQ